MLSQGIAEGVRTAALAPDGQAFALGREDGTAPIWTTAPRSPTVTLEIPAGQGLSLAFTPDSATLMTGTIDGIITRWDVSRARPRGVIARLETPVMALACSLDGNRVAAACRDQTVRIWDPATGRRRPCYTDTSNPSNAWHSHPTVDGWPQAVRTERCGSGTS